MGEEIPSAVSASRPARRRLISGASLTFGSRIAGLAAGMVLSVFIARRFGPAGSGTYALAANFFGALLILAPLGLPSGASYAVSHGLWPLRHALGSTQRAALALGAAGGALGYAFYALVGQTALKGVNATMAAFVMVAVPFGIAWTVSSSLLLARERYEDFGLVQVLQPVASAVFAVALSLPFGLTGLVAGFAASHVVTATVSGARLLRHVRTGRTERDPNGPASEYGLRGTLAFGVRSWGADVLQFLNYRLDLFVVSAYASRAEVGVYAVAVSLTMLAWLPPGAIQQVIFPRTASLAAAVREGDMPAAAADEAAARALRLTAILLVPTALVIVAVLLVGVPLLYGARFHETPVLGLLLMPGVIALGWTKVLSAVVMGRGRPIYGFYSGLIDVPVTVALYLILIPDLGATGAAIGSSASYLLTTAVGVAFYRRVTSLPVRESLVPRREDFAELAGWLREARAFARRYLRRAS